MKNDRICDDCGECDRCDLDPAKLCDNCCQCLGEADYNGIILTGIEWDKRHNPRDKDPGADDQENSQAGPDSRRSKRRK